MENKKPKVGVIRLDDNIDVKISGEFMLNFQSLLRFMIEQNVGIDKYPEVHTRLFINGEKPKEPVEEHILNLLTFITAVEELAKSQGKVREAEIDDMPTNDSSPQ